MNVKDDCRVIAKDFSPVLTVDFVFYHWIEPFQCRLCTSYNLVNPDSDGFDCHFY